jgi:hypothetical protein
MIRRLAIFLLFVSVIAFSAPAEASPIYVTGDTTFTISWQYTPTTPDLSAEATFKITGWTGAYFDLAITNIKNTTATSPDIKARFTAFGFGLTPDAESIGSVVPGVYFTHVDFGDIPSYKAVDICAWSGPNCQGGAGEGLGQGSLLTDSVSMRVYGGFGQGVTFYPFAVKFQTELDSYEFGGSGECKPGDPNCELLPDVVPEPASMVLFGTGLIAAASVRRFRRKK